MRRAECKDCIREIREGKREEGTQWFTYPEAWATGQIDRGGSRSDRCREHRQKHQHNIAGMAVAYIDLETVGEVADRKSPTGPLGGLGPLPDAHSSGGAESVDLGRFGFGMDESHIRRILESLSDPDRRVLIVKAGTGTGKSTYMPYRLLDPPDGCYRLIDNGPIVVTEPRVQATVGVAEFVGAVMSGAGGVGPGFPVGYQAGGDKQHDASCQLIYVTDGTMINWLREGRLSQIGTVIVDEAHERSTNIDFILGYLKRELPRYPHLRVIVTSATFSADFYQQYFGGEAVAGKVEVPAVKTIGYGWPLFPDLDVMLPDEALLANKWRNLLPQLALRSGLDEERLVQEAWPAEADPLKESEVADSRPWDVGYVENLHDTTRKLLPLRFKDPIPVTQWKTRMPEVLGRFVVQLAKGLDAADIYGDILGFLPTGKNIEEACDIIRAGLGDRAEVFALLSSLPADDKRRALEARRKGDRRKIVVSTNLAETSLTVEGVRFVVDSGLIAQSEWDPSSAQGGIRTKPHSQAGIRQRWGRVGRKAPGWVFPLYTKGQLVELSEDTDPGSTRDNLEQLIMTAKLGGIDDVVGFDWPAAFLPTPPVVLDATATAAREKFIQELARADEALKRGGAVDEDGDPTSFGKELSRFSVLGSTSCTVAVMYADRLGCVPEVATILALLHEKPLIGPNGLLLDRPDWPDEWRFEAAQRHRGFRSACEDDAELVLQLCAGWERSDPGVPPWEPSAARRRWARSWWVNDDMLREAATARRDILASLSPAMKEEVKRFIEPALLRRARGVISRAMASFEYRRVDGSRYRCVGGEEPIDAALEGLAGRFPAPERILPLSRRTDALTKEQRLSNIVVFEGWATDGEIADLLPTGLQDAMRLLLLSSKHARPDTSKDVLGAVIESWPVGQRMHLSLRDDTGERRGVRVQAVVAGFAAPDQAAEADAVASVVVAEEEGDDARPEDAAPELDKAWPSANPPEDDTGALARRALLDSREVEAAEQACRRCLSCLAGNFAECSNPNTSLADVVDVLAKWRERATAGHDVTSPLIEVADMASEDAWWEIVDYRIHASGQPVVVVTPDWRPNGLDWESARHPDLVPGQHIDLLVGPMVEDHRDTLRVLWRPDHRGRFLLREANPSPQKQEEYSQLAISLSRRHQELLKRLTEGTTLRATVVPHYQPGALTVTLLELLHQHFQRGHDRVARQFEVRFQDGRTGEVPFYPARVVSARNRNGFVETELLIRDSACGIIHGSAFFVPDDTEAPNIGTPIWLRLTPEPARLSLRDIDLGPIRELVDEERSLRLVEGELADRLDDDTDDGEEAAYGGDAKKDSSKGGLDSVLTSRRAVSQHVARRLVGVSNQPDWSYKVWRFWAQSRYLRPDRLDAFRLGGPHENVEVRAELRTEVQKLKLPVAPEAESVVRIYRRRLEEHLGVTLSLSGQPLMLSVEADDEESLDAAAKELKRYIDSKSRILDIPQDKKRVVIGTGGERVNQLRAKPGILHCNFGKGDDEYQLLVVAETQEQLDSLVSDITELINRVPDQEHQMYVPVGMNGRLIGTNGVNIRDLLRRSGCSSARAIDNGSTWVVKGPSVAQIEAFARLAAEVVPGCRLL